MARKTVFTPGGGRGVPGPVPVRPEDTIAPVPSLAQPPVPVPTGPESTVGAPVDAGQSLAQVTPVGVEEHVSPVNVPVGTSPTGAPVTSPELRRVSQDERLRQAAAAEEEASRERFAVSSELPEYGADFTQGVAGSPETARNYLAQAASVGGIQVYSSKEEQDQRSEGDKRLGAVLKDDDVGRFINGAETTTRVLGTPGTVLNNALEDMTDAWNIDSQEKADAVGPSLEITFQEGADAIKKYKFADQIINKPAGQDKTEQKSAGAKARALFDTAAREQAKKEAAKDKEQNIQEAIQNLGEATTALDKQGPVRGLLNHINQSMAGKLGAGSVAPYADPTGKSVENYTAAAAVLAYWIRSGWITLGKDKNGQVLPFLTPDGLHQSRGSSFFTLTFNPRARQEQKDSSGFSGNVTTAGLTAPFRNQYIGAENQAYSGKGNINLKSHALSSTAITYLNQVGVGLDTQVAFPIAQSIFNEVQGDIQGKLDQARQEVETPTTSGVDQIRGLLAGDTEATYSADTGLPPKAFASNSEFGKLLGELDEDTYETYLTGHRENLKAQFEGIELERQAILASNKMIQDRINQLAKHFTKHAQTLAQNPLYTTINSSDVTLRFFVTGSEVSFQAHSGSLRPISNWANIVPAVGVNQEMVDGLARRAKRIYSPGNYSGESAGMHVIDKLHSLSETELAVLDTLLVMGAVAAQNNLPGSEGHKLWTYDQYVAFGKEHTRTLGEWGKQLRELNGVVPPKNSGQRPDFLDRAIRQGKGEWQYPLTVLESAARMQDAIDAGGGSVAFAHQWETDSTQSNAFIMSTMMGDDNIMGLLGRFLSYGNYEKGDLRMQAANTLTQEREGQTADINNTFHNDPKLKEAMTDFFKSAAVDPGFAKNYGRGIVVAGLYGKTAWKMFSEAKKFIGKYPTQHNKLLNDYYIPKYGDRDSANVKLREDVSNLFAVSMNRHMSSLLGYQTMMKNITDVLAIGGSITQIESLIPNELIMLATEDVMPQYDEGDMLRYVTGLSDTAPEQVTTQVGDDTFGQPVEVGHVRTEKSLATAGGTGPYVSDTGENKQDRSYAGKAARAAVSPNLIQSGDTFGIVTATLLANKDRKPNQVPKNIRTIHDAIQSGAGSTSLVLVAYNDVFPHLVAKQARNYPARLQETAIDSVTDVIQNTPEGNRFIIGDSGDHRSVMGYFDRHFMKLKKGNISEESWNMMSPEEQAEASGEGFYTKEAYERLSPSVRDQHEKGLKKSEALVAFAIQNGWKPPLETHRRDRQHLAVNQDQFRNLAQAIIEGNGMLPEGIQPIVPGFVNGRSFAKLGKGEYSANYTRKQIEDLIGGLETTAYGQVTAGSGKQATLADKLAKNNQQIKNMPLVT